MAGKKKRLGKKGKQAYARDARIIGRLSAQGRTFDPSDDATDRRGVPAVDGTHRAGKRRRGVSVTKVKPRDATFAYLLEVRRGNGDILAHSATMITYPKGTNVARNRD